MATIDEVIAQANLNDTEAAAEFTKETFTRAYIGGSSIGHACERSIALRMRGFPTDKRTPSSQRTLEIGQLLEGQIIGTVKGIITKRKNYEISHTGDVGTDQLEVTYKSYVRAYADGVITKKSTGEQGIIEAKTANEASFKATQRVGVRYAHPEYYDQVQLIMGLAGMQTCLFIMLNKNNSELHSEKIEFDEDSYHFLLAKADYIAQGYDEKVAQSESDWRCSLCNYIQVCWFEAPIPDDKRTCRHCRWGRISEDKDIFSICDAPGNAALGSTYVPSSHSQEAKNKVAKACPLFIDYREKDND